MAVLSSTTVILPLTGEGLRVAAQLHGCWEVTERVGVSPGLGCWAAGLQSPLWTTVLCPSSRLRSPQVAELARWIRAAGRAGIHLMRRIKGE